MANNDAWYDDDDDEAPGGVESSRGYGGRDEMARERQARQQTLYNVSPARSKGQMIVFFLDHTIRNQHPIACADRVQRLDRGWQGQDAAAWI